ncbi:MAG: AAA family ATPase [Candidatus Bathyarchaeia archaeon]|nr:AAA family ATPase [Candidatus Bathyarchaeota archaeon]
MALTGMPGSGKTVIADVASKLGVPVFSCGDVVREAALERGLQPTSAVLGRLMFELRESEGPAAVVDRVISKIKSSPPSRGAVLVEGIRSLAEVEELKASFKLSVMAVHSSPSTRFKRLKSRGRSDDPKDMEEFHLRDRRELDVGIGDVIALADIMIVNEGSLAAFKADAEEKLRGWLRDEG